MRWVGFNTCHVCCTRVLGTRHAIPRPRCLSTNDSHAGMGGLLLAQDQDLSWRRVPVSRQAGRRFTSVLGVSGEREMGHGGGGGGAGQSVVEKRAVQVGAHAGRAGFGKPVGPVKSPASWSVRPCQPFTCQPVRPTNHTPPLGLGNFFPQYCTESLSAAQRLSAFRPLDAAGARWCTGPWCAALLQGRCHGCNAGTYLLRYEVHADH
jgi:hypothetical protein